MKTTDSVTTPSQKVTTKQKKAKDRKKKLNRPYFRVSIRGYYPSGSTKKLSATVYLKEPTVIPTMLEFIAPYLLDKKDL